MRLRPPLVCMVTRARGSAGTADRVRLLERLASAAAAGASMIQVRERQLDDRQLAAFVREVVELAAPHGTRVLVNDRIDIARAAGAGGVHLKADGSPPEDVRRILPQSMILGQSVHSIAEAKAARAGGCDYVLFGTVFPSRSKPDDHPIAGTDVLASVCRAVDIPVLAIGGMTVDRARDVRAAGAAGVAAIALFADAADVETTVRELRVALTLPLRHV